MNIIKFVILTFILSCGLSVKAQAEDPCSGASGDWDGDYYNFQQNCGCHAWYELYKSNDTVLFSPMMSGCLNCTLPAEFSGVCKNGKLTTTYEGGNMPGTMYTGMLELRNADYYLRLVAR